jgi:hypothetical protein
MRSVPALLAFTDGDAWRPGIGDPTVMGWVTVVAYFAVAVLCLRRVRQAGVHKKVSEMIFWSGLTVLLVVLGVNKQLDLQTWLTITGRHIAIAQGWYEQRRVVQLFFILLVGLTAFAGFVAMSRLVRRNRELRLPRLGLVLLLTFVIVRAASFHHIDSLINLHFGGVRMNWVLELGAIIVIGLGAGRKMSRHSSGRESIGSSPKVAWL